MSLRLHHFISGSLTLFSIGLRLLFQVPFQNLCICKRGCSFLFLTASDFYRQSKQQFEALCSCLSILLYTSLSKAEPTSVLSLVLFLLSVPEVLFFYHNFSKSSPGQPLACCWVGCACYTAGSYLLLR